MIEMAAFSSRRVRLLEQVAEALAGHEFQDHVRNAVVFVEFQQVDDVGVVGLGHEPGLLAEPPEDLGVIDSVGPQDLDGDHGPLGGILGAIDDPLASFAQLVQQLIAPQPRAVRLGRPMSRAGSQRRMVGVCQVEPLRSIAPAVTPRLDQFPVASSGTKSSASRS